MGLKMNNLSVMGVTEKSKFWGRVHQKLIYKVSWGGDLDSLQVSEGVCITASGNILASGNFVSECLNFN